MNTDFRRIIAVTQRHVSPEIARWAIYQAYAAEASQRVATLPAEVSASEATTQDNNAAATITTHYTPRTPVTSHTWRVSAWYFNGDRSVLIEAFKHHPFGIEVCGDGRSFVIPMECVVSMELAPL